MITKKKVVVRVLKANIKRVKVKSLFLTKHYTMKTYWWSGGMASRVLDLDTRWR
jgi:hypothetical protein